MADHPMFVPVKMEIKTEEEEDTLCDLEGLKCLDRASLSKNMNYKIERETSHRKVVHKKLKKRTYGHSKRPLKYSIAEPVLHMNRVLLSRFLRKSVREHRWKDASGILTILLKGNPRGSSFTEERRKFLVAMEIHRRFGGTHNYQIKIKQIFEIWMGKLAGMAKCPKKKKSIQMELALFYLTQGNVHEAHNSAKFLIQDRDFASEPNVDLIHGLALYQLWYSGLPEEMQIKGLDMHMPLGTYGMSSNDECFKPEFAESSNDHNAIDMEDANFSSTYASESSVGNDKKVFMDCGEDPSRKQSHNVFRARGFYMDGSTEMNEQKAESPNFDNSLIGTSIFFAHGLDVSLLPIRLKHSTGDIENSIYLHRRLVNENYMDAVKHLRLALYSTPPLLAALLPLIQLLLLGDRVEEALMELEKACLNSNAALPFRLKARLMECFCNNQSTVISSCYENVLRRDPICSYSLEKLIRMHRNGNYSTILLLEMIALHLDAFDGKCSIWGEFASCFLKLQTALKSECEDQVSAKGNKFNRTCIVSSSKIPKAFTEGEARSSWRNRCRWWAKRHFSKSASLSQMQSGDWKLLASKAACASHLYGPIFEYVITVLSSLRMQGENDQISFLSSHMQGSTRLYENLERAG